MTARWLACWCLFGLAAQTYGQDALPAVAEAEPARVRVQAQRLLQAAEQRKVALPAGAVTTMTALLRDGQDSPEAAARLQATLDGLCLVGVTINPESRVKAARGPAGVELRLNEAVDVLVRVHNEAGVTAALAITGPQLRTGVKEDRDRWLEATLVTETPLAKQLSGNKVDYLVLRLTAREAGKREATLHFDVGQGTQDLGFRAEVPILFTIRPAEKAR